MKDFDMYDLNDAWEAGYEVGFQLWVDANKAKCPDKFRVSIELEEQWERGKFQGKQDFKREKV